MSKPSICCVVPTIRPESMAAFRRAWGPLFERHGVTLITVWDGDDPVSECTSPLPWGVENTTLKWSQQVGTDSEGLVCRRTDACRNLGFIHVANLTRPADLPNRVPARQFDYILTLDDDVHPTAGSDPIQEHLDVLGRRVPVSWMNTATEQVVARGYETQKEAEESTDPIALDLRDKPLYLRGFPYGIREEAQVMVSHGVWVNVPDFDGKTQLELGKCPNCYGAGTVAIVPVNDVMSCGSDQRCPKCNGTGYDGSRLPYSLPYFRGPVPKGCYLNFCGMNVMVRKEALPYLYFAPMGLDSGVEGLNRFADIWCGILLKRHCDAMGWAIYTGASTVIHTRASDPFKNVEQEKLGMEWNEKAWQYGMSIYETGNGDPFVSYWRSYLDKAARFRDLIRGLQSKS